MRGGSRENAINVDGNAPGGVTLNVARRIFRRAVALATAGVFDRQHTKVSLNDSRCRARSVLLNLSNA